MRFRSPWTLLALQHLNLHPELTGGCLPAGNFLPVNWTGRVVGEHGNTRLPLALIRAAAPAALPPTSAGES